jgi:ABC-2 type transport system permease protein
VRAALAYEWRRITTVRSTYWFSGLTIGLSGLIAFFIAFEFSASDFTSTGISNFLQASTMVVTAGGSLVAVPVISAALCGVMGAMAFGHEYRYGTIKQTLTAVPDRLAVFAAKLVVLVGWLLVLMLLVVGIDLVLGEIFLTSFSLSGNAVRPIVDFVAYNVAFGVAGLALAAILRNLAGALVTLLVYPFVVDPIVYNIFRFGNVGSFSRLANLLPASAGRRTMYSPYELFANNATEAKVTAWGLGASTAVFWAGILLMVVVALALFLWRDA